MSQSELFMSESGSHFKKQKRDTNDLDKDSSVVNYVKLKFIYNEDNEETYFKVHRKTKIGRVFESYSQFKKLQHQVDFLHNGERVNRTFTVDQLGIEDGDEFHVMSSMHGGGWMNFM